MQSRLLNKLNKPLNRLNKLLNRLNKLQTMQGELLLNRKLNKQLNRLNKPHNKPNKLLNRLNKLLRQATTIQHVSTRRMHCKMHKMRYSLLIKPNKQPNKPKIVVLMLPNKRLNRLSKPLNKRDNQQKQRYRIITKVMASTIHLQVMHNQRRKKLLSMLSKRRNLQQKRKNVHKKAILKGKKCTVKQPNKLLIKHRLPLIEHRLLKEILKEMGIIPKTTVVNQLKSIQVR